MNTYIEITDVDSLSDLQVNEAFIDSVEIENARLALTRSLGLPEPELYNDPDDFPTRRAEENAQQDFERVLINLINLQERMSRGMEMIKDCNAVLNRAHGGERLPYNTYCQWVSRRKKLWSHWYNLKDQCSRSVGDNTFLWREYFSLRDDILDRVGYSQDVNLEYVYAVDDMKVLFNDSSVNDLSRNPFEDSSSN